MTDREILRRQLIRDEGLRLVPYRDTKGLLTTGVGYCVGVRGWAPLEKVIGRKINKNDPRITRDEALEMLDADIDDCELGIWVRWPWTQRYAPARQRALVNMAFNLGLSGLAGFKKMWAALAAGDFDGASVHAADSKWRIDVGPKRSGRIIVAIRIGVDA